MNKFEIFSNVNLGSVRTMFDVETGEIWFFANDVARILGYAATRNAIAQHTDVSDRKALNYADCTESVQSELWKKNDRRDKIFVNESGLYCMIFGSKLPAAQDFKMWVTKEVLPSIREHGGYIYGQEYLDEETRNNLMLHVEKLSKDVIAYKEDGDLWMEMYFKLEKEYLKALNVAVPVEDIEEPDTPEYVVTKEGYLVSKDLYYNIDNQ